MQCAAKQAKKLESCLHVQNLSVSDQSQPQTSGHLPATNCNVDVASSLLWTAFNTVLTGYTGYRRVHTPHTLAGQQYID